MPKASFDCISDCGLDHQIILFVVVVGKTVVGKIIVGATIVPGKVSELVALP